MDLFHVGDCLFRFQQQPNTELSCNPYQLTPSTTTTLHATCLAVGPLQSSLQVEWWFSEEIDSLTVSVPERVDLDSSDYRVVETAWTRTANSMLEERLISSSLSIIVDTQRKRRDLCVWCQITAPGRALVGATSSQLCIREPEAYSDHQRYCNLQEVITHNFATVCVQEQSDTPELYTSWVYDTSSTDFRATALPQVETYTETQQTESSGPDLERTQAVLVMSTSNLSTLGSQPTPLPSLTLNIQSSSHHTTYISTDTPSTYIEPSSTPLVTVVQSHLPAPPPHCRLPLGIQDKITST